MRLDARLKGFSLNVKPSFRRLHTTKKLDLSRRDCREKFLAPAHFPVSDIRRYFIYPHYTDECRTRLTVNVPNNYKSSTY